MTKKVYIAYTGGTIGMTHTDHGYAPAPGYLAQQMAAMPELSMEGMPEYTIHEYHPLLDSSNMKPEQWLTIARDIADHYEEYDGFIVLHGTDTMAYTASALPFMLPDLAKPVIVTGSQIPFCQVRTDARENIITSLMIAAGYPIPEVCLLFGSQLLRGCRSVKVDATGFEAFSSPNFPPLGRVGIDIEIFWDRVRPRRASALPLKVQEFRQTAIGALRLFPGFPADLLNNITRPPLAGLVLEGYGVGNGPDRDPAFIDALEQATARGVVIVDTTQCVTGGVNLNDYATGRALARAGVISGGDMTAEAALAKLFYLFSTGSSPEEVQRQIPIDLHGEITTSESSSAGSGRRGIAS